jgi:hypothetical protein
MSCGLLASALPIAGPGQRPSDQALAKVVQDATWP